ncbi:MAG: hypothetical protein Q8L60_14510 [Gammaproteobacteria bacterium]|nr:hypothetical protein [Gammaproteobacteria bacterium]MDP2139611.1 hypothetical protein [Gammaproteobacteria bacterium]MDP2346584.1 hypothetical protein [Gammaproteobacteria bacterium]
MLERLQALARRYVRARSWLLVLAVLSFSAGAWILAMSSNQAEDIALIPTMLLFAWAIMLHSFLSLFAHVPPRVQPDMTFGRRLTARLKRSAYYMFTILTAMVSLLLLVTTLQMAGAWRTMY